MLLKQMIKTVASYSSVFVPGDTILVILLQILSETGTNCRKERSNLQRIHIDGQAKKSKQTDEEILEKL